MLFCFNDTNIVLTDLTVYSFIPGGGIFTPGTGNIFEGYGPMSYANYNSIPLFFQGTGSSGPIELGRVDDVLGTDGFFAQRYHNQRYDDIQHDPFGQDISGVTTFSRSMQSAPLSGGRGNCFLLTG
eukprot:CAMPEP_0202908110 /NCGR_PEP_ID=MMETSP1392-20130828/44936_1 /ASSEMBLY_ACC=CAM_ASM_000868 /TAXON_ID=225041 /ORGANISM="Chlamydomonas chlamydogama, Strain SAG 11-48b" /LENGTH=125 /DNA_ID=CAMNT_0049597275 /DNA_START=188 /DNA_END=561 /DNA_ORIENTATION=-